nr:MAG TPA: hypothetical protein [Caudoviricetes sp.]
MELTVIVMLSIINNALSVSGPMDGFERDFIMKNKFKNITIGEATLLLGRAKEYAQNQRELSAEMFNLWKETMESKYLHACSRHMNKAQFWISIQEELLIEIKNQGIENEMPEIKYE